MSEYQIPKKIYKYLAQYKIVGRKYNKSYLIHPQKVTGWNLIGQELTAYDYPNEELVAEFEKIIGWALPTTFKKFLIRFGLRDINEDYSAIFKLEDGRELRIQRFAGLIEMIPFFPEDVDYIYFASISNYQTSSHYDGLFLKKSGEVLFDNGRDQEFFAITPTFEQFLEKIEFRKKEE